MTVAKKLSIDITRSQFGDKLTPIFLLAGETEIERLRQRGSLTPGKDLADLVEKLEKKVLDDLMSQTENNPALTLLLLLTAAKTLSFNIELAIYALSGTPAHQAYLEMVQEIKNSTPKPLN